MLKNITITNFRGIKELTIEDFGRVNLLVGGNNSGKTSVLEAVGLVANPQYAFMPFYLNAVRDHRLNYGQYLNTNHVDTEDWKHIENIFYNNKLSISIKANSTNSKRGLVLSLEKSAGLKGKETSGLKTEFFLDDRIIFDQEVSKTAKPTIASGEVFEDVDDDLELEFIRPYIPQKLARIFGEIQKIPSNFNTLIETLRGIYTTLSISDLRLDDDHMILCNLGTDTLLPLSMMGDGFISVLNILLRLATTKNGIVLIDEIDTGLHYSVMVDMWKAALHAAKENNVQIFATTHSDECIAALNEAYREVWKDKEEDEIKLYRIQKNETGSKIRAVPYDADDIETNLANHWEVR